MYSRSRDVNRIDEKEIRIPQNYRGNAFSSEPPAPIEIPETNYIENNISECEKCEHVCEHIEERPAVFHGFSFEDILLIALIMILSQNGETDDILILLALLLAYKK